MPKSDIEFRAAEQHLVSFRPRAREIVPHGFHCHPEVEINFLDDGECVYSFGTDHIELPPQRMVAFWAAFPHRLARWEFSGHLTSIYVPLSIFLRWPLPENFRQQLFSGHVVIQPEAKGTYADQWTLARWHEELHKGSLDQYEIIMLELEARLKRLALTAQRRRIEARPALHGLGRVDEMVRFLTQHYTVPIRIATLAKRLSMQVDYAIRMFRDATGVTPAKYMTQLRVAHAQRLLAVSDMKITEIAMESGFSSINQFYIVFHRYCKSTPKDYRREAQEQSASRRKSHPGAWR